MSALLLQLSSTQMLLDAYLANIAYHVTKHRLPFCGQTGGKLKIYLGMCIQKTRPARSVGIAADQTLMAPSKYS